MKLKSNLQEIKSIGSQMTEFDVQPKLLNGNRVVLKKLFHSFR